MKKRLGLFLGFTAAVLMAGSAAYAIQNADVTGEWILTMTLPDGSERVSTLNLTQEGTAITGTSLREGQEEPGEVTGTVDGNNVTLNIAGGGRGGRGGGGGGAAGGGGRGGGRAPRPYTGTVDGDTMSGSISMGQRGDMEWTAKRQ